jgi:hypothetical protein
MVDDVAEEDDARLVLVPGSPTFHRGRAAGLGKHPGSQPMVPLLVPLPANDPTNLWIRGNAADQIIRGEFIPPVAGREFPNPDAYDFTILTAARSGEAIGAQWDEFDLERGVMGGHWQTDEGGQRAPSAALSKGPGDCCNHGGASYRRLCLPWTKT